MPIPARVYDRSLNAEVERLLYQVQVVLQEAEGLVSDLSEEQFHWSPSAGGWSIGQHFSHLNLINTAFQTAFDEAVRRGRSQGILNDGPYTYGAISRWMLRFTQPPVRTRTRAPKKLQPGVRRPMAEILETWREGQHRFTALLQQSNGLDLVRLKVPNPVINLIKHNLGAAYWIKTAHDRRHLWLIRELRNGPGFRAAQGAPKQ